MIERKFWLSEALWSVDKPLAYSAWRPLLTKAEAMAVSRDAEVQVRAVRGYVPLRTANRVCNPFAPQASMLCIGAAMVLDGFALALSVTTDLLHAHVGCFFRIRRASAFSSRGSNLLLAVGGRYKAEKPLESARSASKRA